MASVSTRRMALLGSVSTALLVGAPAFAQQIVPTPAEEFGTFLGRIIFGLGAPRVAIDTPQSVSVIEQGDIDREQAQTVGDVLREIPGVQIAGGDNPLGQAFNIRGIGLTEQPASEARIIVNVDGAPKFYEQYRMGSFFSDTELYNRVEVLRGPASSTLYGSGALGGVVNFTTKDPSDFLIDGDTSAIRARLGYGSNGDAQLASVIWAQSYGAFETLANLNYRTSDDYEDGAGDTILGSGGTSVSGLLKGVWTIDADRSVTLSYQHWTSSIDDGPYVNTGGQATIPVFGNIDRDTTDQTFILAYEDAASDNPMLDLTVQLSYSNTTAVQENHTGPFTCGAPGAQILCDTEYGYETLNLKVENSAEIHGETWDNYLTYGTALTQLTRVADNALGIITTHPEGVDQKFEAYAQNEFIWNDRLTLIGGARVTFTDRTPGDGVPGDDVSNSAVSNTLAAHYEVTDNFAVFGSVASTERLPTLDELYTYSVTQAAATDLNAETSLNYELGFSFDRQGVFGENDSAQIKVTAFRNDVENLIMSAPASDPIRYINVGEAQYEGYEVEAGYDSERLFGRLAYSHVNAFDTAYDYRLASNPADRLTVTLGTRLPAQGLEFGWRGTFAEDITTEARSAATGIITPTDYDGYALHDLYVTWTPDQGALEGYSVNFAVENVFDETYSNNLVQDNGRGLNAKLTLTATF